MTKTEVGYSQGYVDKPTYNDVCSGTTGHSEVVRVQYDPKECSYETLLDAFWDRHDPTTLNRQVGFVGLLWFLLPDSVAFVVEFNLMDFGFELPLIIELVFVVFGDL